MQMAVKIDGDHERMLGRPDISAKPPDPVTDWCMIIVRPGMEQEARDTLRRRGVGAWWPNFHREVGAKDRDSGKRYKRLVLSGVLPGVLLSPARFSTHFWNVLDLAPGVINVVRKTSTQVVLLSDIDIALIHTIEAGLNKALPVRGSHSYAVGETIRIVADDLRRLGSGKIVECARDGIITAEVNVFGRATRWQFLPEQIEPLDGANKNQTASAATDARDRPAKSPRRR